jgi:hypothetical protein
MDDSRIELYSYSFHVSLVMRVLIGALLIPYSSYNSAISTSNFKLGYATIVASESFLSGASVGNWDTFIDNGSYYNMKYFWNQWPDDVIWNRTEAFQNARDNAADESKFERLSNKDCIHKYSQDFAVRSTLVMITEDLPGDSVASVHQYYYWRATFNGNSVYSPCWSESLQDNKVACGSTDLAKVEDTDFEEMRKFDRKLLYCLSERQNGDHCRISYSPGILIGEWF